MLFIALPVSYVAAFIFDFGLCGLWLGYGTSACFLSVMYATVLISLDWKKTAEEASNSEEFSQSTECIQTDDDDDYIRVYDNAEFTCKEKIYPKDDHFMIADEQNRS